MSEQKEQLGLIKNHLAKKKKPLYLNTHCIWNLELSLRLSDTLKCLQF